MEHARLLARTSNWLFIVLSGFLRMTHAMELFNGTLESLNTFMDAYEVPRETMNDLFSNLTLFNMIRLSLTRDRPFPKTRSTFREEYDYVIVGAGTAGSVMANRLSQKPCVNVLLLEAGGDAPWLTEIPSFSRMFLRTRIDWEYRTTSQQYGAFSQRENRVVYNSGKALGGSSVLNGMLNVRGNRRNYNDWEREGATGWSYNDVLPYFRKLEDNRDIEELDIGYHGTGGPVTVEKSNYTPEIKIPLMEAAAALGFELTDSNGKRQTGLYDVQGTVRNQQRCSTAKAYLVPAEDRPNLDILKDAFARKILIKNRKAYGVEFDFNGETRTVLARREVIISSGSIRTPQILMLSGIGPRHHLERFNISVVADLPVGQNLQDHCAASMNFLINSSITPVVLKLFNPINIFNYITSRSGPLTAPNQMTFLAFLDGLGTTAYSRDFPRQEIYLAEYTTIDARLYYGLRPEVFDRVYGPYVGRPMYTCVASLLQPRSRGEILLNSTNPYDQPLINPNYYKDERDIQDVVEGLKICKAIGTSREMQRVQSRPFETSFPGCEDFIGDDDRYFACHARNLIVSFYHAVGTARMGQPDDPRSVVDPELKVIGVEGLRVVNAAVMPIVPSGNINVPTIMVAEKVYDMMKDDVMCRGERRQRGRARGRGRNSAGHLPWNLGRSFDDASFNTWLNV